MQCVAGRRDHRTSGLAEQPLRVTAKREQLCALTPPTVILYRVAHEPQLSHARLPEPVQPEPKLPSAPTSKALTVNGTNPVGRTHNVVRSATGVKPFSSFSYGHWPITIDQ
ncbi:hypothetical protein GCM10020369_14450 [Cryptosporangium minutisporangium]|uniref:Uncharacterized protein n=1 Tax=Cryptosporangium minutisporangium TaxID=113569 RepID=A0ABP6SSI5_9ACTN